MSDIVLNSASKLFRDGRAWFRRNGNRAGVTCALDALSLTVSAGHPLVLLGPNGAGKSTLLRLVCTMFLPDSGQVLVDGFDTRRHGEQVRRRVGFTLGHERSFFPRLTAAENLEFFAALEEVPRRQRRERVRACLEKVGLEDAGGKLVMKFSSGMCQRLGLARALLKRPSVLLLDEPTRSLDPASAARCWNLVRQLADEGVTVVLATHNLEEAAAVGNTVAVLQAGRLAALHRLAAADSAADLRRFYFENVEQPAGAEVFAGGPS